MKATEDICAVRADISDIKAKLYATDTVPPVAYASIAAGRNDNLNTQSSISVTTEPSTEHQNQGTNISDDQDVTTENADNTPWTAPRRGNHIDFRGVWVEDPQTKLLVLDKHLRKQRLTSLSNANRDVTPIFAELGALRTQVR